MQTKEFPFERFEAYRQETQDRLIRFEKGELRAPLIIQRPSGDFFDVRSHTKEDSLAAQLDALSEAMELHGDATFGYLEPWRGVGVYAEAFGAKVIRYSHTALQTEYRYHAAEEAADVPYPVLSDCSLLQAVLETIRYFRAQTGGAIPICLTDTQSPNDTASLILDSCELFAASVSEPETIRDLLSKVTRLIEEFSLLQIEEIGEGNVAFPGHMLPSDPSFRGISLSDDNMAVISPASYRSSSFEYLCRLSRRFGGAAIHSCGTVTHNLPLLLQIPGLRAFECAAGYGDPGHLCDPNPNSAADLLPWFSDRDITLKVRLGPGETGRLLPLLSPRVRLIVELCTYGTVAERNRQFDAAREKILTAYERGAAD